MDKFALRLSVLVVDHTAGTTFFMLQRNGC